MHKTVCINTELKIRYRFTLVLRILRWLITKQSLSDPLLGCLLLEALGLNTRQLLAAAADIFASSMDAERLVGTSAEKEDCRISLVMEGVFHADGGQHAEEGNYTREDWRDIGNQAVEELEEALSSKLSRARSNEISEAGLFALEKLWRRYRKNVRVRSNVEHLQ